MLGHVTPILIRTTTMKKLMICWGYPSTSRINGYAIYSVFVSGDIMTHFSGLTFGGGAMMTITYETVLAEETGDLHTLLRTEGIRWTIRTGSGDFPVGQFDAQNRLPKGNGIPSLASSVVDVSGTDTFMGSGKADLGSHETQQMSGRNRLSGPTEYWP